MKTPFLLIYNGDGSTFKPDRLRIAYVIRAARSRRSPIARHPGGYFIRDCSVSLLKCGPLVNLLKFPATVA